MSSNVITFPEPAGLFPKRRTIPVTREPEEEEPKKSTGDPANVCAMDRACTLSCSAAVI
jgi:hypothetical protein